MATVTKVVVEEAQVVIAKEEAHQLLLRRLLLSKNKAKVPIQIRTPEAMIMTKKAVLAVSIISKKPNNSLFSRNALLITAEKLTEKPPTSKCLARKPRFA